MKKNKEVLPKKEDVQEVFKIPEYEYNSEIYLKCECNSEGLFIWNNVEYYNNSNKYNQQIYINRFKFNSFYSETLLSKIKYIFKFLTTGKRFGEDIIFSNTEAKKLLEFLKIELDDKTIIKNAKKQK